MDKSLDNSDLSNCTLMLSHLLDQTHDNGAAMMSLVEGYIGYFSKHYYNLSYHEQEDILQEVSMKLICHGEKVRRYCTKSWVYTVVRNQCINHVRDRTRRVSLYENFKHDQANADATGALPLFYDGTDTVLVDELDCMEKVFNQVESRPTGQVDIFLYTLYAFGFSYTEISARSKRTVGSVGMRISFLKKQIKTFIDKYC